MELEGAAEMRVAEVRRKKRRRGKMLLGLGIVVIAGFGEGVL